MIENLIFDLDGTLVDTSEDIIDCLNKAYAVSGQQLSQTKIIRSHIGPPLPEMIKVITPHITDEARERVIKAFRCCYDRGEYAKTKVFQGVSAMLQNLHNLGIRMFVVTNKLGKPARNILKFFLSDVFTDIVTPDLQAGMVLNKQEMIYYVMRKWDLPKLATAMVGDSASDIMAAHDNGVIAVAVLSGYGDTSSITASKPEFVVQEAADLYALMMTMRNQRG